MGTNLKLTSDAGVERLLYDMECLFHESKSADTVFFVGVKETPIPCHSFLLKQRCRNYRGDTQRYPGISGELFQTFLTFVYTGKLCIEESSLLDLLCLANEFGMDDLEKTTEELIYRNLDCSPIKACSFLTSALIIKKKKCGSVKVLANCTSNNNGSLIWNTTARSHLNNASNTVKNNNCNGFNNGTANGLFSIKNSSSAFNNCSTTTKNNNNRSPSPNLSGISKCLTSIIDYCTKLIGENPGELFQSSKFLSIPMETLITIISSDQLCLEEEQIWRHVLKWAQFNANVDTPLVKWTEEDRTKVAKFLTPVISHVRLLLIDSRVFAEEVEPTGCVPMELSLERYKHAALSQQQFIQNNIGIPPAALPILPSSSSSSLSAPESCSNTLSRLVPRNPPKLFQASVIIQKASLAKRLNEWYLEAMTGKQTGTTVTNSLSTGNTNHEQTSLPKPGITLPSAWKCIYRASLHGFSAEAFHKHCDGFAPTYTIVQMSKTKCIVGGFTDIPWTSPKISKYVTSNKSFLFSYNNGSSNTVRTESSSSSNPDSASASNSNIVEPIRFKVAKKHFAVCHYEESGPIFGAGADLFIASNCDINSDSYCNLHSYEYNEACNNSSNSQSAPAPASLSNGATTRNGNGTCVPFLKSSSNICSGQSSNGNNIKGIPVSLSPTYNFVISDYEVFIPIEGNSNDSHNQLLLPRSQSISCVQNSNNYLNAKAKSS